jgi:hypothetical protein
VEFPSKIKRRVLPLINTDKHGWEEIRHDNFIDE